MTNIDNSALTLGKVFNLVLGFQNNVNSRRVSISFGTSVNITVDMAAVTPRKSLLEGPQLILQRIGLGFQKQDSEINDILFFLFKAAMMLKKPALSRFLPTTQMVSYFCISWENEIST